MGSKCFCGKPIERTGRGPHEVLYCSPYCKQVAKRKRQTEKMANGTYQGKSVPLTCSGCLETYHQPNRGEKTNTDYRYCPTCREGQPKRGPKESRVNRSQSAFD